MNDARPNNGDAALAPAQVVKPGQIVRQEFGGHELAVSGETAATAAAASAKALVEARFVMALRKPRDWDDVRVRLLRAVERPGFAGKDGQKSGPDEAWYHKPVGEGVEGFTIRFAEEAMRCMGNIDVRPIVSYEDDLKRLVDVMVIDLESNIGFCSSAVVIKTVERNYLKQGEVALRQRMNSKGRPVFTRAAEEDEVRGLHESAVSKVMRNEILRMLPGDIKAACRKRILEIRAGEAAKDPEGLKREIVDAFAKLNVMPAGLKQWLGHDLTTATPGELVDLRELYKAIGRHEITWHDALSARLADRDEDPPPPPPAAPGATGQATNLDELTDKLKGAGAQPAGDPKPCEHMTIPRQRLEALSSAKSLVCPDCQETLPGLADPAAVSDEELDKGKAGRKQRRIEEA